MSKRLNVQDITILFLFIVFFVILLRTVWICDDAAITSRTVLNFIHGYGPNFNIDERVQTYTHPLWFLLLSFGYWVSGNIFYSTLVISILIVLISLYLFVNKLSIDKKNSIVLLIVLLCSQAFVDYSTSGLENPMCYLLIAIFILIFLNQTTNEFKSLYLMIFIVSLIFLNRPDSILLVLPMLLYASYKKFILADKKIIMLNHFLIGGIPVVVWKIFSIIYYGFPWPNTAYAKLGTGIPNNELFLQGFFYFIDSIKYDPITLIVIILSIFISIAEKNKLKILISIGIVLYLLFILKIGGDFMSGRFFALPFFVSVISISRKKFVESSQYILFAVLFIGGGLISININNSSIFRNVEVDDLRAHYIKNTGICDERKYYYQDRALISGDRFRYSYNLKSDYRSDLEIRDVLITRNGLGYAALFKGPQIHVSDQCAIADPLLSRMNAMYKKNWRIGHFYRKIPDGYEESILQDKNLIEDKKLKIFYDEVRLITRGDLFAKDRLTAILKMNLGYFDYLLLEDDYFNINKLAKMEKLNVQPKTLLDKKDAGTIWDDEGNIIIPPNSYISFEYRKSLSSDNFDISFDHNDKYYIIFYNNEKRVLTKLIYSKNPRHGLDIGKIKLKTNIKFNKVNIIPYNGDRKYSIGHFIVH